MNNSPMKIELGNSMRGRLLMPNEHPSCVKLNNLIYDLLTDGLSNRVFDRIDNQIYNHINLRLYEDLLSYENCIRRLFYK
jgi:hypothetical protein